VPIAAVTAVLAIIGALVAVKLSSGPASAATGSESLASSAVVRQVTTVPAGVLMRVSPGQAATPLQTVKAAGPPLTIGGKPAIVFVSEESCSFCAAERWPSRWPTSAPGATLAPPRHRPPTFTRTRPHSRSAGRNTAAPG
jgi:hypothetical protein